MSGTEIAAVITAIGGFIFGLVATIRQMRSEQIKATIEKERQETEETASLLVGYSAMVEDLRLEIERLRQRIQELEDKHDNERELWEQEKESLKAEVLALHRELNSYMYRNPGARTRDNDDDK